MFGKKFKLKHYFNSIIYGDSNKKNLIYRKIINLSKENNNEFTNYKEKINKFQNKRNFKSNYQLKLLKTTPLSLKKSRVIKFINIIKEKRNKEKYNILINKNKYKNRSIDLGLKKLKNNQKNSFVFFFKLPQNIRNSWDENDNENLFREWLFVLFELYLKKSNKNSKNLDLFRRKSFNSKANNKQLKLFNITFEEFIYNLIIKIQLKNNFNFKKLYIPKFLRNIKYCNIFKLKNSKKTFVENTENKVQNLVLRMNKVYQNSLCNLNLDQEIKVYNLLVNYVKKFYKMKNDDFALKNKNTQEVRTSLFNLKLLENEKWKLNKSSKKREKLRNDKIYRTLKNIDIIFKEAKINKSRKFSKILKNKRSNLLNWQTINFKKTNQHFNKKQSIKTNIISYEKYFTKKRLNKFSRFNYVINKNNTNNEGLKSNFQKFSFDKNINIKKLILREFLKKKNQRIKFKSGSNERLFKIYKTN